MYRGLGVFGDVRLSVVRYSLCVPYKPFSQHVEPFINRSANALVRFINRSGKLLNNL